MNSGTQHPIDGFGRLYHPAPVSEDDDDDMVVWWSVGNYWIEQEHKELDDRLVFQDMEYMDVNC